MTSSLVAATTFLVFVGLGYLAQVVKLLKRVDDHRRGGIPQELVCSGLLPFREFIGYLSFVLFAFSGLTRTYLDQMLLWTRLPVVVLSTAILWILAQNSSSTSAKRYLVVALICDCLLILLLVGVGLEFLVVPTDLALVVDLALAAISFVVFYAKLRQAFVMFQNRTGAAVALSRELGIIVKDATGLVYALDIGAELYSVALTHALSIIGSTLICIAKLKSDKSADVPNATKNP